VTRRLRLVLLALPAFAATPAAGQDRAAVGAHPARTATAGPATVCGTAFSIRLAAGESAIRQEGTDFTLYNVTAADGPVMLYEGNFPQPNDDEVRTGQAFPAVVAVHDRRPADAKARSRVRDRLLTGEAFRTACPGGRSARRTVWDGDFTYEITEFVGPGHYCSGGFVVRLDAGDRILFLNPRIDFARMVLHLGGHRVQAFLTMVASERRGSAVRGVPGDQLREIVNGTVAGYEFGDPPALVSLDSPDFRGHAADGWFLGRLDLRTNAERGLTCIEGRRN